MTTLIGQEVGGYRIISQVGKGGMATVYKAFQASLDRYVALKVMPPFYAQEDETFLKRFKREAQAVAKLRHPNILIVLDFGEYEGLTYIVMEYVDAGTLTDRLGVPMPLDETASIVDQVASALDYAHGMGVVHRDVKPSNILLPKPDWPLLTDFGLAKIVGGSRLTLTGSIAGTPAYMSPEQGQGEDVDARSDIYSLGIVLYEMTTGFVPFYAETPMAIVVKHIIEPLPLPSSKNPALPEAVERVILKALAKNPEDRYPRVIDLAHALNEAVKGTPTMKRRVPTEPTTVKMMDASAPEMVEAMATGERLADEVGVETFSQPAAMEALPAKTPHLMAKERSFRKSIQDLIQHRPWLKWFIPVGLAAGLICIIGIGITLLLGPRLQDTLHRDVEIVATLTPEEHITAGQQFFDEGDYEAAIGEFQNAIALGIEDPEIHFQLAQAHIELGQEDEALDIIGVALATAPQEVWVHERAGLLYQSMDHHEEAIAQFEHMLELDPEATWILENLAASYRAIGNVDKANQILDQTQEKDKEEDPAYHEELGWEYLHQGNLDEAEAAFNKAVFLDSAFISAWEGLAEVYTLQDNLDDAVDVLEKAIEINPNQACLYEKFGWVYWSFGEYDIAEDYLNTAIEMDPANSTAYITLSNLLRELGDNDQALEILHRAIEKNPARSDAHETLGFLYLELGRFEEAFAAFERTTELDPTNGWAFYGLGKIHRIAGEKDEAIVALDRAIAVSNADPRLLEAIGWEFLEMEKCDQALSLFEEALALDPTIEGPQLGIAACTD
jgi:serine/threonine protein kinase/tetratricopeptide (TPR) repeat protein